ncbi:MAG: hypothetical protein JNG88_17255, partial [Phycisphaerales bacterium]|nr:hypothetical protein [Phycisphaerales bacterium]
MKSTLLSATSFVIAAMSLDAIGQTWQSTGSLPTSGAARVHCAGVNYNGLIYAIGGTPWQNGTDHDGAVHRLSGGTWAQTASLDGMGPVISQGAAVDGLGRLIVFGGY